MYLLLFSAVKKLLLFCISLGHKRVDDNLSKYTQQKFIYKSVQPNRHIYISNLDDRTFFFFLEEKTSLTFDKQWTLPAESFSLEEEKKKKKRILRATCVHTAYVYTDVEDFFYVRVTRSQTRRQRSSLVVVDLDRDTGCECRSLQFFVLFHFHALKYPIIQFQ